MRRRLFVCILWAFGILFLAPRALRAEDSSPGIPIHDPLTIAKCGGCHAPDSMGRMRRLSYIRTTPEVWEQAIKRMMRLQGLSATPAEIGKIVRYLSANNGLAPEEAKPIFWEAEHRRFRDQEDPEITPAPLQTTCNTCHTVGRVLSQRRTREDYEKLANLHMALFRYTEIGVFRPYTPSVALLPVDKTNLGSYSTILTYPEAPQAAAKAPLDVALDYLSSKQPLITPEWTAWQAIGKAPSPIGSWWVSGYQKGRGKIYGQMTVEPGLEADEFVTKTELHYANSGRTVSRTGKGIVYTGYSWRGRSKTPSTDADPSIVPAENKEAVFIERDAQGNQRTAGSPAT